MLDVTFLMKKFLKPELGLLYATRASENAQTLEELRRRSRCRQDLVIKAINGLIAKGILKPIESYDDRTVFGFAENDFAQTVYCLVYQVEPVK